MAGRKSCSTHFVSSVIGLQVLLHLLKDKYTRRCLGKPADRSQDFVVLEEVFHLELVDAPLGLHKPQDFVVPVLADVGETAGEDDQAALTAAQDHLFENTPVHVVVVDHAGADDDVECVLPLLWELVDIINIIPDQLRLTVFCFGNTHHALR